jgi:membrane protein implicated in regulation of membrane protease activity
MGAPGVKAIAVTIFIGVWGAIAVAVIYFASVTGYSFWVGAAVACALFFLVNGSVAYRFRARQLRQQGKEPPPFLVYLFYPKPINFKERVALPRPFRVLLGIVILIGGAFLVLTGTVLLFTLDLSKVPHPVGAVIALVVLASVGVGSLYVGVRLVVMKNDEPMLKGRKSSETKSSSIDAA